MQLQLTAIAAAVRRPFFRAVAGLGATQLIGWGTSFSAIPIFGTPIAADLNLAREWVFGGITIMLLISAVVAPRVGRLVDRLGARPLMVVGSLLAAVAMLCQGWAWNLPSYLFAWVLVGLATPMMLGNAAMPGLVQVVGPNARSAITSLMLISGLTSTVFLPFNAWLLATIGWRDAYVVFALVHLLVCAPLHWFALRTDVPKEPPAASAVAPSRGRSGFPPDGLLPEEQRRGALVLLSIWMSAEGLITWGLYLQIIDILVGLGLTANQSIAVWAIVGPCQAVARLIELMSAGRHSILTTSLGAALGVSLSFLALLPFGVTVPTAVVFCICIGTGHGLFAIARNTLPLALFGTKEYGTYIGLLTVPQNICNAIAPVAFAAILSHFSAAGTIWISAVAAWTGLVAVVFLNRFCRAAMKDRGIDL